MPRHHLRRISRQYRQNHASAWYLRPFAALLRHPMYFAMNRRSVTGALAIGLFISLLPVPGHTPIAVIVALLAGVNLGVAALAAWINTPLTLLPVFYGEYRLGAWLLGMAPQPWPDAVTWEWLRTQVGLLWRPLFLGAGVTATVTTALVYVLANAAWRWAAARRLKRRRARAAP
ncbi:MAG: DUF2062 domain-containing protein [Gammaproteobacteria bacterium]|nr:DUF2062 domain-containing protein [Gammaproteobacteria bacterium]